MKTLIKILIACVFVLMLLGCVLVFSASGTYSSLKFDNIYVLFKSHIWKVVLATVLFIVFSAIPYEVYKKNSKYLMFGILGLLLATLIFAPKINGATRWLNLGFIKFQPSEMAKIILVMHLARMIDLKNDITDFTKNYRYLLFWIFAVAGLVVLQPNMSTASIIIFLGLTVLFVGGASFKHLGVTVGSLVVAGGSVMMFFSHSRARIINFIQGVDTGVEVYPQVQQSKIALGSGGLFGVGIGHSRQSDLFLPESYSDFIFSILGEELGFIGAVGILFIYLTIFFIGIMIAKRAKDNFGQLLAFGISFNIVISGFINSAVALGVVPTTGITLPFISFGGTSIILFAISTAILVNIGLDAQKYLERREQVSEA